MPRGWRQIALAVSLLAPLARAADRPLAGSKLLVQDPTGDPLRRKIVVKATDPGATTGLAGNPASGGAAGGVERRDDAQRWLVGKSTAIACPATATTTTDTTTTSTSTTTSSSTTTSATTTSTTTETTSPSSTTSTSSTTTTSTTTTS